MSLRSTASRIFDRVLDVCAFLACALLVLEVISVSLDVILRQFFDVSLLWITAFNEWSLLFVAFLGAGWLEREGGHTRDDSIIEGLGPEVLKWSARLGWLLGVCVCAFLIWYGAIRAWNLYQKNVYDFFKLREVPIFWIYAMIPIGSLLWLIQLSRRPGHIGGTRGSVEGPE